ncbi:molybdopterin-dependent oxidoreductase [Natronogracilivirga saccharolytica]|uniref:Molybdopterin-dependent oxidoreductase n=1 Tax=Natronogracilivirga saccharolytica TaxID=2812953 RepID=A0A8J7UW52_9BACT|nr:molybdopterin-dependent oxidoreductase [Natronogracilivirga saccharolytica]MBP3193291.1 molybdopterin-dependent oxidoreductase [Natronogracilivirga saccharolytica]
MKTQSHTAPGSRKSFLKKALMAGSGLTFGSALSGSLSTLKASESGKPDSVRGGKNGCWAPTTCNGCASWCSLEVYIQNGRATKIRGNNASKVNEGKACPRSHMGIQELYDPDRLKQPMKRTNPEKKRGVDPGFVPISWDEAIDEITDRILELREKDETHKYMMVQGRNSGLHPIIYDRMTRIIGSPNRINSDGLCQEAGKLSHWYQCGFWGFPQWDLKHTRYIICWGTDPVSSTRQVSHHNSSWGKMIARAKVAVVDPRLSATAAKADEWMPIKPGEDGAVAGAIAHVILTRGLWSKEFVGDFKDGENRFKIGQTVDEELFDEKLTKGVIKWWNLELKDRTPEWAAERAGIPAEQIERVAIDFGRAGSQAISMVGRGPVAQPRGSYNALAGNALVGLVGAVGTEGGNMSGNPFFNEPLPGPDDYLDQTAKNGLGHPTIDQRGRLDLPAIFQNQAGTGMVSNKAADGVIDKDPNEIKVAISYYGNFAFSAPGARRWEKALGSIPFYVDINTHPSEVSWFADIVLPAANGMFEKNAPVVRHGNRHRHVTLHRRVVDRLWNVKSDETEVPWMIAEKLAEKGFPNLLDHYKTYRDPETGAEPQNGEELELFATKHITQNYWNPDRHRGGDKFESWESFYNTGVWNSDPYVLKRRWGNMPTESGKFEFYSEPLKRAITQHAEKHGLTTDQVMESANYVARGEQAFIPHYEPPVIIDEGNNDGLILVDHKSRLNREGRSANSPWYYEFKDVDPGDVANQDVAKINPKDARRLGISEGDDIVMSFKENSITCKARLWEGVRPGTVAKSYGQGHWAFGRRASLEFGKKARGGNNNEIIPAEYDRLTGTSAYYATVRVRVSKA